MDNSNSNLRDSFENLNESLGHISVESDSEESEEFPQGISSCALRAIEEYDEYVESDSEILESLALNRPPKFISIINSKKFREAHQELRAKMLYFHHTCLEKKRKLLQAPSNIKPTTLNITVENREEELHSSSTDRELPQVIYTTNFGRQTRRKPCFELEQGDEEDLDTEWQSKTTNRSKYKKVTLRSKAKIDSPHETASPSSSSQKSKKKGLRNNESKYSFFSDESLVTKRTWSTKEEEGAADNSANGNAQNQTVENKKTTMKNKYSKPSSKRTKTIDSYNSKDCVNENTFSRRQVKKLEEVECPLCKKSFSEGEIQEHAARCGYEVVTRRTNC